MSINQSFAHLSFDDVCSILQDITLNDEVYSSIFDNPVLSRLKCINSNYDAKFTLYILERYDKVDYKIENVTKKFKEEFKANSDWLKFGFHSIDLKSSFDENMSLAEFMNAYTKVNKEIESFASKNNIARVLRLHYFRADKEKVDFLRTTYTTGLLCADDDRISYDFTDDENIKLNKEGYLETNGMLYYKTNYRLDENIEIDKLDVCGKKHIVIFAHEWSIASGSLERLEKVTKKLYKQGVEFSFFE